MAIKFFDRVQFATPTSGGGALTIGPGIGNFVEPVYAGAADGNVVPYLIEQGDDFEIGYGAIGGGISTMTRAVTSSRVGGVYGTGTIDLDGETAVVSFIATAADIQGLYNASSGFWRRQEEEVETGSFTIALTDAGKIKTVNAAYVATIGLPALVGTNEEIFVVANISAYSATVDPNGAETINNTSTVSLAADSLAFIWPAEDKSKWRMKAIGAASLSASLTAIGALTPVADYLAYFTGPTGASLTPLTSLARNLLSQSSQAGMQSVIGASGGGGGGSTTDPSYNTLAVTSTSGLSLSTSPVTIGSVSGANLGLDADEIQARSAGSAALLGLNRYGGDIYMGGGNTVVSLLGGRLKFPASQIPSSDANVLDDYEEGTFTPTITGASVGGAGSYTVQNGEYQKVGSRVLFSAQCAWSSHSGSGGTRLAPLPFNAISGANHPVTIRLSGMTFTGALVQGYVPSGANYVVFEHVNSNAAPALLPNDSAADILISGHYRAAA